MEIYSKEDFIKDLKNYLESLQVWNDKKNKVEQLTNSTLEGFLEFLEKKAAIKN